MSGVEDFLPVEKTQEWFAEQRALVQRCLKRGWIKPPGAVPEAPALPPAVKTPKPKKKRATVKRRV
jgi:hypothetical protein